MVPSALNLFPIRRATLANWSIADAEGCEYDPRWTYFESTGAIIALEERGAPVFANALFFWHLRHPVVRLTSSVANEAVAFALGLSLPWLAATAIVRIGTRWSKILAIAATIPSLIYSALVALGAAMTALTYTGCRDPGFARIAEIPWKGSDVSVYRTDGGATTDFGIVVRQERTLFLGVQLVRIVDSFYHCHSLDAAPAASGIVITDGQSDGGAFPEARREYRLQPFVYF